LFNGRQSAGENSLESRVEGFKICIPLIFLKLIFVEFVPSFMESSGQSANSSDQPPPQRWAEFLGTAIALITLTLPVFAIAHYSPSRVETLQRPTLYSIPLPED
jgi:hypothetical protein